MYIRTVLMRALFFSMLINVGLLFGIFYISFVKTDLCYRALAKLGFVEYDIIKQRQKIEYRCLEGWSNCLSKQHAKTDAVFYGNSITFESDFQFLFPQAHVCNLGCNRDNLDDMIHRSFIIRSVKPQKVFLLGGINSILDISLDMFEKKYKVLVDTIMIQNPSAQLYLQSMLPVNIEMEIGARYKGCQEKIKEANRIIKMISQNKGCQYVDLYSAYQVNDSMPRKYTRDGLHLYPEAYSIWAQSIYPYLTE